VSLQIRAIRVDGLDAPRLDGATLRADEGELVVLIGPNGAGKSTLLHAIAGLAPISRGEVLAAERPLSSLHLTERAAMIAWLPQQSRVDEGLTALDLVASARFRFREPWPIAAREARKALSAQGATAFADRLLTTLSGGELQRVRLAALRAQEARWWLLDEPGNHLDPAVRLAVLAAVADRVAAGAGALLVTHDVTALDHLPACRVVGLRDGTITFDLPSDSPDLPDRAGALLGLRLARVVAEGRARWVTLDRVGPASPQTEAIPTRPRAGLRGGPALVIGLAALGALLAPWIGPPLDEATASFVLGELRLPRAVLGAIVGGTLALAGAAFQTVLENPLATPSTIGTTAGASLGALAVLVLAPAAAVGAPGVALGAFVGALAVSLAVAALATLRRFRTEELLLAGIAISLGAGAAITGLQLGADAAATLASVRWSLGSLAIVGYDKVLAVLPLAIVGAAVIFSQQRALQGMASGAEHARTLGVRVVRTRTLVLGAGSLAVAGCVAVAGPIAFVGLVVPHLVRLAVGGGPRRLLLLSTIAGAGFLPLADGLARVALPGRELPVGVLTAALGAPALLALLWRRRPR